MKRINTRHIIILAAIVAGASIALQQANGVEVAEGEDTVVVDLPAPKTVGSVSVAEALARRRSHREFADERLSIETVAQLCWAAQGITDVARGFRTAPSAGALFPITVFVADSDGAYEYRPDRHQLRRVVSGDVRKKLQAAALGQSSVGSAPVCMVITFDVARTASKYGRRAERYCLLEAGHVAQNVLLQATALGVVGVPVGAVEEKRVAETLELPRRLSPVYLLPLGRPIPEKNEAARD